MKRTLLGGIAFLVAPGWGGAALARTPSVPPMIREEFELAKQIYFDRSRGRHGVFHRGVIGPTRVPGDMRADDG